MGKFNLNYHIPVVRSHPHSTGKELLLLPSWTGTGRVVFCVLFLLPFLCLHITAYKMLFCCSFIFTPHALQEKVPARYRSGALLSFPRFRAKTFQLQIFVPQPSSADGWVGSRKKPGVKK